MVRITFTPDEKGIIGGYARRVWQEIGCEIDEIFAGSDGPTKAETVEQILDCNRLVSAMRRAKVDAGLIARVETALCQGSQVDTIVKQAMFPATRRTR